MLTKEQVRNIIDRNKYWLDVPPLGDAAREAHIAWVKSEMLALVALIGALGACLLVIA